MRNLAQAARRVRSRRGLSAPAAALLAALAAALVPAATSAACNGRDMLAELAREDPEAHAQVMGRAAAVPNGEGLLWRVDGGGASAPSHLFGTVHSTGAARAGLPTAALAAIGRSRLLLVEITPDEEARLGQRLVEDPGFAIDSDGPRLARRFRGADRRMAREALEAIGTSLGEVDRLQPWLLISILAVPPCERAEQALGARVVDDVVVDLAEGAGIPVAGLETYEEALGAFDRLSEEEMTALLRDGLAGVSQAEDIHTTMEALYAAEQVSAILAFSVWVSAQAGPAEGAAMAAAGLERALLADRNRAWFPRILEEVRAGGAFVAVGALHLPGKDGLVALLRGEGFTVTRVPLP